MWPINALCTLATVVALHASMFVAVARAAPDDFEAWAVEHGKTYRGMHELQKAHRNFLANERIIERLNADAEDPAKYGHSRFSDLAPAEFRRLYLPLQDMDAAEGKRGGVAVDPAAPPPGGLPTAHDWRDAGAVTPVRDQGGCGSCWAESAVGSIESAWYLANRGSMPAPTPLSVEQVIECDPHDHACWGGWQKGAYQYTIDNAGLASEADYPYVVTGHTICLRNQTFNDTCGDGMCGDPPLTQYCDLTCSDKSHAPAAKITAWAALPANEDRIAAYLTQHGPVAVGVDADGGNFVWPWLPHYRKGIANPRWCTDKIDHGVLLVGYGEEHGMTYWIVKNSWGAAWGEAGYFRLARGAGKCAVASMATSAIVGPSTLAITV